MQGFEQAVLIDGLETALIGFAWAGGFQVPVYDFGKTVAVIRQQFKDEHTSVGDGECGVPCTHGDEAMMQAKKQYLSDTSPGHAVFVFGRSNG
jgi:hypothetical protein